MGFYILRIFAAYVPLALVTFSEHIADHKNLSSLVGVDLLKDPGLSRTLMGDGLGSIFGSIFGGCANTTYGESISCVGMSKNASTITILLTGILALITSFIAPVTSVINSIPPSVMGGIFVATYGFISVSGLKMLKNVDLDDMRNVFVIAVILISGIGAMAINVNGFTLSAISVALILGILVNILCNLGRKKDKG